MPEYRYTAVGNSGAQSEGILTAGSEAEVMSLLDSKGLFPVRIEQSKAPGKGFFGGVGARQMAVFYSQLADLLQAGVPLLRSLEILERQSSTASLVMIVREIRADVADGTTLADSMSKYPKAFSELAVSMVRAGQEGGFLEDVLKRIAIFTEHQEELKSKVMGALAYPIFLLGVGSLVLIILVIVFVPMFQPIFDRLEQRGEMPQLTKMLIGFSEFMIGYWWVALAGIVLVLVLFVRWSSTESGRRTVDVWKLNLPVAGKIYLNLALSRFTRIQGTLLQNGIPLLQALRIAKDSTGNKVLTDTINRAADNVTAGDSLATPLQGCKYIPNDVVEMIAVGEESNNLEKVLLDIANALETRTARNLDLFVRLLEPLMLLVMAGFTLLIVLGLLLPIFKMSSTIQ
ncbi:MAG: type II secretion system F family protein [Gemmataceae bacterium]